MHINIIQFVRFSYIKSNNYIICLCGITQGTSMESLFGLGNSNLKSSLKLCKAMILTLYMAKMTTTHVMYSYPPKPPSYAISFASVHQARQRFAQPSNKLVRYTVTYMSLQYLCCYWYGTLMFFAMCVASTNFSFLLNLYFYVRGSNRMKCKCTQWAQVVTIFLDIWLILKLFQFFMFRVILFRSLVNTGSLGWIFENATPTMLSLFAVLLLPIRDSLS